MVTYPPIAFLVFVRKKIELNQHPVTRRVTSKKITYQLQTMKNSVKYLGPVIELIEAEL